MYTSLQTFLSSSPLLIKYSSPPRPLPTKSSSHQTFFSSNPPPYHVHFPTNLPLIKPSSHHTLSPTTSTSL
jgi:alpha-N-acetylglucosamine transferase